MTQLVGILNITPDSFSDGGQYNSFEAAITQAQQLFADGAAFVDIGAESTRPGATKLTPIEEWQRLMPVLTHLLMEYPDRLSLDTYHPQTALSALEMADIIINDVTGMNNPEMVAAVADRKARCIISHLPGTDTEVAHTGQLISDINQVKQALLERAGVLEARGVPHEHIILDPGIGFGKTPELNHELLRFAELIDDYPVMIGYSRKRFLGDDRLELEPNLAAGRIAIASGAAYLRVHDVAGHRSLITA